MIRYQVVDVFIFLIMQSCLHPNNTNILDCAFQNRFVTFPQRHLNMSIEVCKPLTICIFVCLFCPSYTKCARLIVFGLSELSKLELNLIRSPSKENG